MLDKFTIKELLGFIILLNSCGLVGLVVCYQMMKRSLMDNAAIFKAICKKDLLS